MPIAARSGGRPGDDRDAAVVRDVERLVRVGRPRVGASRGRRAGGAAAARPPPTARTRRRRAPRRRARGPPRWPARSGRTRPSAGCRPAGRRSPARCRRPAPRPARRSRAGPRSSAADHGRRAEAEVAQRQVDASRAARRRPARGPAAPPASPSRSTSQPAACELLAPAGGQAGEVGHRRAGDEADVGVGRQPEQVEQPAGRGLLDRDGARRRVAHRRCSGPSADQPVGGQRGRQRAADDPAEEPPGRHRHQPGLDQPGQHVDDLGRVGRPVRQRPGQLGGQLVRGQPGRDRAVRQRGQPGACVPRRRGQGRVVGLGSRAHG